MSTKVLEINELISVYGGVAESIHFSPFGETNTVTGTQVSRLQFTGRENDDAATIGSCLYQYRARYLDCERGQFLSEDPKGFAAGINLTAYANNNPVNANDPSGLDTQITLGYTNVAFVDNQYHTFPILTDTITGAQFATRGGPGGFGGYGFGQIQAKSGNFGLKFQDYNSMVASQEVGTISRDYNDSVKNAKEFANATNNMQSAYFPLGPNSNSYASSFIESMTGARPPTIMGAPGSTMNLAPSLSYNQSTFTQDTAGVATFGLNTGTSQNTFGFNAVDGNHTWYPTTPNNNNTQTVYSKGH